MKGMEEMQQIKYAMIAARAKAGLSQSELSKLSGVEQTYISSYENGKHVPNITNIIRLADALNISIDEYIGRRLQPGTYHPSAAPKYADRKVTEAF